MGCCGRVCRCAALVVWSLMIMTKVLRGLLSLPLNLNRAPLLSSHHPACLLCPVRSARGIPADGGSAASPHAGGQRAADAHAARGVEAHLWAGMRRALLAAALEHCLDSTCCPTLLASFSIWDPYCKAVRLQTVQQLFYRAWCISLPQVSLPMACVAAAALTDRKGMGDHRGMSKA